jgi:CheY-like chemotaxis protein
MLREQKDIAERTVHQKSRFLASASHDLRQPMHAISLYLDGLAEMDLPERAQRAVSDARICAHDMIDMFRSFLDISRLDAQHAVPLLGVFPVGTVLSRVEKEFLPLARSRGVSLKVRPCGAHVYSDAVMVERMALNFVSNAVRHTDGGRVLVACRIRGKNLRLAVYDNGRGIPEEDQQTIFEEFRGSTTDAPDRTGGLGLGLAIVKRLANSLRIPVVVRSIPGRGSMFAIDLPLVHVPGGSRERAPVESALTGKFVVLVDDEPSILKATSFILEGAGCVVAAARTSREAFDDVVAGTRVPDAIICDYELNDRIKGPEVIRLLREEFNCDVPALLVTGDTAGGAADRAGRQMGIPVLYKPLEAGSLTRSLEGLLAIEEH